MSVNTPAPWTIRRIMELYEGADEAKVKALVCTPTFTNPTGALMGAARRRRLAEVARALSTDPARPGPA